MTDRMTAVFECDLRAFKGNPHYADTPFGRPVMLSVGDEVKRLSAEVERLQAALLPFAEAADECDEYDWDDGNQAPVTAGDCRAARDALERRP